MAVPSSGALNLSKIANEKHFDNYNQAQLPTPPYSLKDISTSGNSNGSGVSYDVTTQASASKPDGNTPHNMSEFYGYDHDTINVTIYESSFSPSGTNYYTNGTDDIGHATKSAACSSTNTINTCVAITWTGTLGNGTVLYHHFGNSCVQNTVLDANNRYVIMGNFGGGIGSNCGTDYPGGTVNHVMKVSDTGVVSEFSSSCVTLVGLPTTTQAYPKPVFACGQTTSTTRYFPDTTPAVGDTVYTNSAGTATLAAGHYGLNQLSTSSNYRFTVDSSGEITLFASC